MKIRNVLIGSLLLATLASAQTTDDDHPSLTVPTVLYSSTMLLPLFVQTLLSYTAMLSGLVLSPGAIVTMAGPSRVGTDRVVPSTASVASRSSTRQRSDRHRC